MRASACFVQSSAIDFNPRVDIDINGSQQPNAEAMTQHRIVSRFICDYLAIGGTLIPGKYSGALPLADTRLP